MLKSKIINTTIYMLMAWPFIWENANKGKMMASMGGSHATSFSAFNFLPDEIKYLEALLIVFLFLIALINNSIFKKKLIFLI